MAGVFRPVQATAHPEFSSVSAALKWSDGAVIDRTFWLSLPVPPAGATGDADSNEYLVFIFAELAELRIKPDAKRSRLALLDRTIAQLGLWAVGLKESGEIGMASVHNIVRGTLIHWANDIAEGPPTEF